MKSFKENLEDLELNLKIRQAGFEQGRASMLKDVEKLIKNMCWEEKRDGMDTIYETDDILLILSQLHSQIQIVREDGNRVHTKLSLDGDKPVDSQAKQETLNEPAPRWEKEKQ